MKDWLALRADLLQALKLSREDLHGFMGSTDGQDVVVERMHGSAVDWIILRTPICTESEMEPTLVLERNGRLAFAVMVLAQGIYWLRVAVPFDSAELNDPQRLVALLVDAARSLSPARIAPSSAVTDIFDHYCT